MDTYLRPLVSYCRMKTVIRQRKKISEKSKKNEKYRQKNFDFGIVYNTFCVHASVCVCVCVCVDYICVLLCVVVHVIVNICVCMMIRVSRSRFEIVC